jgi:osmoprotectant transport system permease protein
VSRSPNADVAPADVDDRPDAPDPESAQSPQRAARRSLAGYFFMPAFLAVALGLLYLYVSGQELGSIERRLLNADKLTDATLQHIELTLVSTALVLVIAVPLGILLTRRFARPIVGPVLAVFNTGQATPSIGVLALFAAIFLFIGYRAAIVGLVAYASLSVLRNTMVGLEQVDRSVLESGRGMGMTRLQVLRRIELPLAVPVILAGVRTALVINVGTATLVTFINAGGLGDIINGGIAANRQTVTLTGAVLAAALALFVDYLAGIAEDVLRPRGL